MHYFKVRYHHRYLLLLYTSETYPMDKNVAMVYRGVEPHPAHVGFAKAIDADIVGLNTITVQELHTSIPGEILNGFLLDKYDVVIAEGTRVLYGIFANQVIRDTTLIYLGCDQALYELINDDYSLDFGVNLLIKKFGVGMLKELFKRYVDGAVVVSPFTEDYVREFLSGDTPVGLSFPYIQPDVYSELVAVVPLEKKKTAVTVGVNNKYKGIDLLVNAWPIVRETHPEAKLKVVGKGHPKKYERTEGVEVLGFVESLSEVHNQASLYIQPSRADAFAVTVVEAMRAGVPPIVTNTTGSKVEVAKLSKSLISEPQSERLATSIVNYFNLEINKKKKLSTQCQSIATDYKSTTKLSEFKRTHTDVLEQIDT
jgi:glycosyltransferase involved in cell wall biosynthesis